MLDDPQLLARLKGIFRSEYADYAQQLQAQFKSWSHSKPDEEALHEAFRTVHNLKGAAGAIGLLPIAHLAHQFENLLQQLRSEEHHFNEEVCDIGYAFLTQIEDWLSGAVVVDWESEGESEVGLWITNWLEGGSTPAAAAPEVRPHSVERTPPEVDFVRVPVPRVEAILSDITELSLAQNRLRHRQNEVDEAFRLVQEMHKDWERLYSLQRKAARERGRNSQRLLELLEQQRGRFRHFHSWFRAHRGQLLADRQMLDLSVDHLSDLAHSLRLVPLDGLFDGLERQARDLARRLDKVVEVQLLGGDTHIDRRLLDALREPLSHLLRNCLDHGLESISERQAAGKNPAGCLRISARPTGQLVVLEVGDDGAGINWEKVRQGAAALGWLAEGEERLAEFLFRPGFTTRDQATEVSGRGYGLDIVEAAVEALHGRIELDSQPGRGTTFRITLPLTQATVHGLLVSCADQLFGVGISSVERALRLRAGAVTELGGELFLREESQLLPLLPLSGLLGLPASKARPEWVVVISPGHMPVGLVVDGLVGERELVVKPLGPIFANLSVYEGGALLEDGEVALLLNPLELVRGLRPARPPATRRESKPGKRRILVVDDSITSRTLEKSILENAGYDVVTGSNGEEGVRLARTSACHLVISDVEMPRMDGYQLARALKADPATAALRVILVTSLASPEDRARGQESGADAYVVKGEFDQTRFLELVAEMVGE